MGAGWTMVLFALGVAQKQHPCRVSLAMPALSDFAAAAD